MNEESIVSNGNVVPTNGNDYAADVKEQVDTFVIGFFEISQARD